MKIGILENGRPDFALIETCGDFADLTQTLLGDERYCYQRWHTEKMEFPSDPTLCDGWILTGSKHGAYEDHAFIPKLEAFIQKTYALGIPMVGICFGHQIIAKAMGAIVEKHRPGWVLGHQVYTFSDGDAAKSFIRLNAWHQDQVLSCPTDATPIAYNDKCRYAALRYGENGDRALTFQPHPEFDKAVMEYFIRTRRGTLDYPDDGIDDAHRMLETPNDSRYVAGMIFDFFENRRQSLAQP